MAAMEFALVAEAERDCAIGTLVSAFEDDPVERWLYPDEADYRRHFPAFIAAFGGDAFRDQTVWRLGDFAAVAFWFGPGREPDGDAVVRVYVGFPLPRAASLTRMPICGRTPTRSAYRGSAPVRCISRRPE